MIIVDHSVKWLEIIADGKRDLRCVSRRRIAMEVKRQIMMLVWRRACADKVRRWLAELEEQT